MESNFFCSLFVLSMVAAIISGASGACTATGTNVTAEGFLMDNLCIELGTLVDNPKVISLQRPDLHSIKCIVDVPDCVASGYVILSPPTSTGGNYSVKYDLGVEGSALAKTAAEEARKAGATVGLQLKVVGIDDGTKTLKCVSVYQSSNTSTLASPSPKSAPSSAPGSPPSSAPGSRTPVMSMIMFSVLAALAA